MVEISSKAIDITIRNGVKTQNYSKHQKRKHTFNKHLNAYFVQTTLGEGRN